MELKCRFATIIIEIRKNPPRPKKRKGKREMMIPVLILAIENDFDRDFMTSLYYDYNRLIYYEVRSLVGASDEVEDLVQETLARLIGKVELLERLDQKRLAAYIADTAKNVARNHLRRNRASAIPAEDFGNIPDTGESVEEQVIGGLNLQGMEKLWETLPEDIRTLFRMKYFLHMTNEEIGRTLGIKPESVRMRISRARRKVLALLETESKPETD